MMPDRRLLQVDVCFNLACEEKVITPLKRISIEISKTNVMYTMYVRTDTITNSHNTHTRNENHLGTAFKVRVICTSTFQWF